LPVSTQSRRVTDRRTDDRLIELSITKSSHVMWSNTTYKTNYQNTYNVDQQIFDGTLLHKYLHFQSQYVRRPPRKIPVHSLYTKARQSAAMSLFCYTNNCFNVSMHWNIPTIMLVESDKKQQMQPPKHNTLFCCLHAILHIRYCCMILKLIAWHNSHFKL